MHNEDYSVCDVYNGIEGQFSVNSDINININYDYINSINEDYLYKMNILYNLYQNYVELNAIDYKKPEQDKQKLLILSTACCTDYNKAKYICNGDNKDNNTKFCEKLTAFQSKYDKLYEEAAGKGSDYSKNFIRLSECGNNKIITTAVTGTVVGLIPLLGVLYKFTPMGQLFKSKIGILNNDISNNDEEMTKISLMDQENESLRFKQGTYNIKYQSL
ncbi:Plasmodium vivax Vir protein, putative [Plasmodium vivax]|uniref:Vir protein, putative n=1 Tax=Plasmodium vivax TaxID=5855 RepID=A0A1G4ECM9_PLAVI|nr:Plasmodium vivax Vir protein, putative [Plasmodium vivax]